MLVPLRLRLETDAGYTCRNLEAGDHMIPAEPCLWEELPSADLLGERKSQYMLFA